MERSSPAENVDRRADPAASYGASWVDRLQALVDRRRWSRLPSYVMPWLALAALVTVVGWRDGAYPFPSLDPLHLMLALTPAMVLYLMHVLNRACDQAFESFGVLLDGPDEEADALRRRLTTLPARPALAATVAGGVVGGASAAWLLNPALRTAMRAWVSPLGGALEAAMLVLYWMVLGVFVFQAGHQLRHISRAYARWSHVNLFRLEPAYAFASVTALTALGTIAVAYGWVFTAGRIFRLVPSLAVYPFLFSALAVAVYVGPLLGAHRLLQREKQRRLADVGVRLERALEELREAAEARDVPGLDALNRVMTALGTEQAMLERVSTWPWRPETTRWLGTAVLLPLGVFVAQRVIVAVFGL